jgi:hypothetical protein
MCTSTKHFFTCGASNVEYSSPRSVFIFAAGVQAHFLVLVNHGDSAIPLVLLKFGALVLYKFVPISLVDISGAKITKIIL